MAKDLIKPFTVEYDQYEKITDDIYFLGYNVVLRMNVSLARKSEDGRRFGFHSEFMYNTNKYINADSLVTVRRSFDYYLTIENLRSIDNIQKESIMIRVQDILLIRQSLDIIYQWFTSEQYRNLFAISKNKLVKLGHIDPIVIQGLPLNKKIVIEPIVVEYENASYEGIRLFLNSTSNYVDMTVDKFMGLKYLFDCINLYESAQLILNYHGRPEYGHNMMTFETDTFVENEGHVQMPSNRQIKSKKKQESFFDKIDKM